jgi:hypothetical protein
MGLPEIGQESMTSGIVEGFCKERGEGKVEIEGKEEEEETEVDE